MIRFQEKNCEWLGIRDLTQRRRERKGKDKVIMKGILSNKYRRKSQESGKPDEAVVVPQADIDRLEEARVRLCRISVGTSLAGVIHFGVAHAMYQITHRKYLEKEGKL